MIAFRIDDVNYPVVWEQRTKETDALVVRKRRKSQEIGLLAWNNQTGEIRFVHVAEKFRRRGIATALLQIARERYDPKIKHSPMRSFDGNAWVESLGEHLPRG